MAISIVSGERSCAQSPFVHYSGGVLFVEGVSVVDAVREHGSPIFIVSRADAEARYARFIRAFSAATRVRVHYAVKANDNLDVVRMLLGLGAGVDVNSEGELYRARVAGAKAQDVIMSGVGKTVGDLTAAIEFGIKMIKVESVMEMALIEEMAAKAGRRVRIGLRVTPGVDPRTNPHVVTGSRTVKFGMEPEIIMEQAVPFLKRSKWLQCDGVEMHIGSNIFETDVYVQATKVVLALVDVLRRTHGFDIRVIDLGGGFGITYNEDNVETPIEDFARDIIPLIRNVDAEIVFEPGRYIIGNSTILATEVQCTKTSYAGKNFIIVDGGMTELIRPVLYDAHHDILPVRLGGSETQVADVVGPVCESGDYLALARAMPIVERGDLLAVMSCGAYCSVMSSRYNARRRAAEVMVSGTSMKLIRRRETLDQLIENENK